MKLRVTCDCGTDKDFDSKNHTLDFYSLDRAIETWKREHVRAHEKDGDHDDHTITVDVVPRLVGGH